MKPHLIFYFLIIIFSFQIKAQGLEQQFIEGSYHSIIEKASKIKVNNNFNDLFYLARSYAKLNQQRDYFKTIKLIGKHQGECEQIAYYTHLSYYYQIMMFTDSCTHTANIALKRLYNSSCKDSLIISETYRQYANAMRNGEKYHEEIKNHVKGYKETQRKNQLLKSYLDTALLYASTNDQKGDIYHTIGTMLSDATFQYTQRHDERYRSFGKESMTYLEKAISLELSPHDISRAYAIIGLNEYYLGNYKAAEKSFLIGLKYATLNRKSMSINRFISISDWLGMTYETMYEEEQDELYLKKANSVYNKSVKVWDSSPEFSSFNDAYHNSALTKLIINHLKLFKVSNDSIHLHQTFKYIERSKYPDLFDENVSIRKIQDKLKDNQAFINYGSISRPWRNIAYIITKSNFTVTVSNGELMQHSTAKFSSLYQFKTVQDFKRSSNTYYKVYFEMVDSILTNQNIQQIIVSNSDNMSMMNLDLLIKDTIGEKWADLNYLFKRYNISYALSASSFINQKKADTSKISFGVSLGNYENEANLRFSNKLTRSLSDAYGVKSVSILENINKHGLNLLLSHGSGGYENTNATVRLNSETNLSSSDIEKMKLNNELVIFSACNTNASQRHFSQGAIGNFNKAFRKAGSKSVITTSWAIDDQSNAFIIHRFIHHLTAGKNKSEALWQAKKEYWEQSNTDESFNPLYWAPYILTGNTEVINIKKVDKSSSFNYYWLLILLLVPTGFLLKNRFF